MKKQTETESSEKSNDETVLMPGITIDFTYKETLKGGKKAAATNMKKHGKDFYKRIGAKGGRNGHTGGFAANPELARIAGAKGGKISKRGKAKK